MYWFLKIQPNMYQDDQEDTKFYKYTVKNVTIILWGKKDENIIMKQVLGI